jgi:hypothetical protein
VLAGALPWLLQEDNPAIRFFTLRDLLDRPLGDPEVERARRAIVDYPPVRAILDHLSAPGYWERSDDEHIRRHLVRVLLLGELGVAPDHPPVRRACDFALDTMQRGDGAFPSRHPVYGGARPCTQGLVTEALLRLAAGPDPRLERAAEFAATMTYECSYNGGLPCAWGVVKLLRALAAVSPLQLSPAVSAATEKGTAFLMAHDLVQADFPHDEAISPEWFRFGFPRGYQTDILETLETLARLGCPPAPQLSAAVDLVLSKQGPDGRWVSEYVSPLARELGVDREGEPSKWITLRALRVLRWWASLRRSASMRPSTSSAEGGATAAR